MPFYLPDFSSLQLAQVVAETRRLAEEPGEFTPVVCERLGRVLIAMYGEQAHPARMFHMIAQVAECEGPDVDLLLPLAWAASEGANSIFKPSEEVN
jgi:hypothetical protein